MTQVKSKKTKYASKVEEQIVDAINSGKSLSGKDGIFAAGTPIGQTTTEGEVDLFVDANQLSFVTVILTYQKKEKF